MDANTMNPDQTAPGFILFAIKATEVYKQMRQQMTIVVNNGKSIKRIH